MLPQLLGLEYNFLVLFVTQFKMLPELFQDDEKAISPTSATSSGRTPLTRVPVKPTKGRPGQTAKEHKKTVGHQVSSGAATARLLLLSFHKASGLPSSA